MKDSDPYVSVLSRLGKYPMRGNENGTEVNTMNLLSFLGEAIQDSETLVEFVKKSFSIISNTCNDSPLENFSS